MRLPCSRTLAVLTSCLMAGGALQSAAEAGYVPDPSMKGALERPAVAHSTDAAEAAIRRFVPSMEGNMVFTAQVAAALDDQLPLAWRAASTSDRFADLRADLTASGLPELFLGLPYAESGMNDDAVSPVCAAGSWQLMPDTAVRMGLIVEDCTLDADDGLTPSFEGETIGLDQRSYIQDGACGIARCEVDERRDELKARAAALQLLVESWEDPVLTEHPQRAALTALSYNTGLQPTRAWAEASPSDAFAGMDSCAEGGCEGMSVEAALYVPRLVAATAIVVCATAEAESPDHLCSELDALSGADTAHPSRR